MGVTLSEAYALISDCVVGIRFTTIQKTYPSAQSNNLKATLAHLVHLGLVREKMRSDGRMIWTAKEALIQNPCGDLRRVS